jgi:hypothetical protein
MIVWDEQGSWQLSTAIEYWLVTSSTICMLLSSSDYTTIALRCHKFVLPSLLIQLQPPALKIALLSAVIFILQDDVRRWGSTISRSDRAWWIWVSYGEQYFHGCVIDRKGATNCLYLWFLSVGAAMANSSAWHRWCAGGCGGMWHEFFRPVYPPGAVASETATICAGHRVCRGRDCCGGQCDAHQSEQETSNLEYFCCLLLYSTSRCASWLQQRQLPAIVLFIPTFALSSSLAMGWTSGQLRLIPGRGERIFPVASDQTSSGAHLASYTVGSRVPAIHPPSSAEVV